MSDADVTKTSEPIAGATPVQRYVVFHRPGKAWNAAIGVLEQQGVAAHFQYLQSAFQAGQIEMAGPFLSGSAGGMIILNASVDEVQVRALIAGDPGVISGLIDAESRLWMVTLG